MKWINKKNRTGLAIVVAVIVAFSMVAGFIMAREKPVSEKRNDFLELKGNIQQDMLAKGKYRCCLEEPCGYCIEKEGAECKCQEKIYNGKHPCGECIGEILEGEGNPLMSEYFATALADELGQEHIAALRKIIEEKYGVPVENQE